MLPVEDIADAIVLLSKLADGVLDELHPPEDATAKVKQTQPDAVGARVPT